MRRVPTTEEFQQFDGAHCALIWLEVGANWRCPCCGRSKFEIMRWTTRFPRSPDRFEGWMAGLHRHHDHSVGFFSQSQPRFPQTVICDQCNAADGIAKKQLGLPRKFSFAPQEIGRFVISRPHDKHQIDYEMAGAIYAAVRLSHPQFAARWS